MKSLVICFLSINIWLLISCAHNVKAIADNQNSNSISNKQDKEIPLFFRSGKDFVSFINNSNIEYGEKDKQIADFVESENKYMNTHIINTPPFRDK